MDTFAAESQPIVYVDTSEVRRGHLDELKATMDDLTEFVEANEPRLLGYHVYFSDDGDRMTAHTGTSRIKVSSPEKDTYTRRSGRATSSLEPARRRYDTRSVGQGLTHRGHTDREGPR
jgi:hypothetical protein